jgi:hypothetical protein
VVPATSEVKVGSQSKDSHRQNVGNVTILNRVKVIFELLYNIQLY